MELLLNKNMFLLYFIVLIIFLKPDNFRENQKIFIVYLCSFFVDCTSQIRTVHIVIISTISLFLYLEYFNDSDFKRDVMKKLTFKLSDFVYLMTVQYYFGEYLIIMLLNTEFFYNYIHHVPLFKKITPNVISVLCFLLLMIMANYLYSLNWKIKSLDEIKKYMDKVVLINNLDVNMIKEKEDIVVLLEDKSFLKREKYTTAYSIDYIKNYAAPKLISFLKNILSELAGSNNDSINQVKTYSIKMRFKLKVKKIIKIIKMIEYIITVAIKKIYFSLKRGHSTIEAQVIRTIGIEKGYRSGFIFVIKRKIFEGVYTKIIFTSLKKFFDQNLYANASYMKEYLLYIYLLTAKIVIHEHTYNGVKDLYNKELKDITIDELFIGVISMSKYNLDAEKIYAQAQIYKYDISKEKIKEILNRIIVKE